MNDTNLSVTVNPSATTTFTVTINDLCASVEKDITIHVINPPIPFASQDLVVCENSPTTIFAGGGNSYLWNTGDTLQEITVTPSQTTSYSVTVSNQCGSAIEEVILTTTNQPTGSACDDISVCDGDTALIFAQGGNSYLWSNGDTIPSFSITATSSEIYSVTIYSDCGEKTDDVVVSVHSRPSSSFILSDTLLCTSQTITAFYPSAFSYANYYWNFSNAQILSGAAEGPYSIQWADAGNYLISLVVSDSFCYSYPTEKNVLVDNCTEFNSNNIDTYRIYPNPAFDFLVIDNPKDDILNLTIIDILGNVVLSKYDLNKQTKIDIRTIANGNYFVKIQDKNSIDIFKIRISR